MRIGITYDLRSEYIAAGFTEEEAAEFDREDTIESIEDTIRDLGYETDRIGNFENLMKRLIAGDRWDIVFNIAEGLAGFGREALVPSLLDAYGIPYTFSDPLVLTVTLHKAMAKRVVRDLGIPTPDFFVIESEKKTVANFLSYPLFVKPVAEGTGKGITAASKITDANQLINVCNALLKKYHQPILVENYLPGREFTVGILGTGKKARAIGVMEVILKEKAEADVYSFTNKEHCEDLVEYRLVDDLDGERTQKMALAAWHGLGCRDAGRVDLRLDKKGIPNFMEVNPLAGLHPEHSDLCIISSKAGMTYRALIDEILSSAFERYPSIKNSRSVVHG